MTRLRCLAMAAALAVAGCAVADGTGAAPGDELTVFAAASLTDVFPELADGFRRRTGVTVRFSFASSATLARQVVEGAPADVFAAANRQTMATVTRAGLAGGDPAVFARNRLVIAVPAGNPERVEGLADLARPALTVALCAPQVPCGTAAATVLRAAGVTVEPDTYEKDVRAVMAKLTLGEVDAALVYHTDVIAAGETVAGIEFPESRRAVNDYPAAVLRDAPNQQAARSFVAYLGSPAGREALAAAGFELP